MERPGIERLLGMVSLVPIESVGTLLVVDVVGLVIEQDGVAVKCDPDLAIGTSVGLACGRRKNKPRRRTLVDCLSYRFRLRG